MSLWRCRQCSSLNFTSRKPSCQICLAPSSPLLNPSLISSSSSLYLCSNTNNQQQSRNVAEVDSNLDSSASFSFLPSKWKPCSNEMKNGDQDQNQDCGSSNGVSRVKIQFQYCKFVISEQMFSMSFIIFNYEQDEDEPCYIETSCCNCYHTCHEHFTLVAEDTNSGISIEDTNSGISIEDTDSGAVKRSLKILSYNVGFREDVTMQKKIEAIGGLIQQHSPDLICFQEVTNDAYNMLRKSSWWKVYRCAISGEKVDSRQFFCIELSKLQVKSFNCKNFRNSTTRRKLCIAEFKDEEGKLLVVATNHLERPCLHRSTQNQMLRRERVDQAREAINHLERNQNVILCGDLNWDDKLDGQFPLPEGWVDAWKELRPGENGWMHELSVNDIVQQRQDRFICNLRDFKISRIDMIGILEAIPLLLLTISSE
ncbi:uncharacterized protein LOC123192137 [Mangifera indica]|uniref:uncharacterized protein LOC123192137 n=1 Tax=Mangifera indica TaxID=29780 RepID=UPI001CFBB783|nr:uncharacterized protein LOC123192137 [Mangifera indica]